MVMWLEQNFATAAVAFLLLFAVVLVIRHLCKKKKKKGCGCCSGCAGCRVSGCAEQNEKYN